MGIRSEDSLYTRICGNRGGLRRRAIPPRLERRGFPRYWMTATMSMLLLAGCTWAPQSLGERYLDRMAQIDARRDFTVAPKPGYAWDHRSVIIVPRYALPKVILIGDSILTGWSGYFAHLFPGALIDARVGRQFSRVITTWTWLKAGGWTSAASTVVVELGTNGPVTENQMRTFLEMTRGRQIFLVMPEMPRSWEKEVQELYRKTASEHKRVHIVRWNIASAGHPGYFWKDMVHPNWLGIQVMGMLIKRKLEKYEDQK